MSQTVKSRADELRSGTTTQPAHARRADMKLEVVVIPVSDVDRAKEFYGGLGGGSTATSLSATNFGECSLHPPVRRVRSTSVRASRQPHPVRQPESISSCLISRRRATNS